MVIIEPSGKLTLNISRDIGDIRRQAGIWISAIFCLTILTPGFTDTRPDELDLISETEFFSDIPSVNTVTLLPQPRSETPAAVTVIDRDLIQANGARDLADIFRLVPGFQVAYSTGHRPAVTYHGLGDEFTRRMQILIDGRSVYGALFGHVSWSSQAIAIEDIDRIEVVRGPNTVTYGANAFLGTINIITRHSVKDHGTSVKVTGGDHHIGDARARFGGSFSNGDYRISTGYLSDDGLDNIPDDIRSRFVNLRMDLTPGVRDTVLIHAGLSKANLGEGDDGSISYPPSTSEVNSHFEQLRWQRNLASDSEISLQFYHNYRVIDQDYTLGPIDLGFPLGVVTIPASLDGTAHRYDVEFQYISQQLDAWRFAMGAGAREDKVESPTYFADTTEADSRSSRLFGNLEWHINSNTILNAGMMWENTDITDSDVSPRLALNHHLSNDHTLRIAWSKARRRPALFEEDGNVRITFQTFLIDDIVNAEGNLDVETMTSTELGYLGRFPAIDTSLDIRIYRDRIDDFITPVAIPSVDPLDGFTQSYQNSGSITVDGIDLELSYRPARSNRIILTLATMNASANETNPLTLIDQQALLDSIPDYSGNLMIMQQFSQHWMASLSYHWVDDMLWLTTRRTADSYQRLDLRLARQFHFGEQVAELALVVQNAGEDYQDFYQDQYFDRRMYATFSVDF